MKSSRYLRSFTHVCIVLLAFNQALAQPSPSPGKSPETNQAARDSAQMIEYSRFLREEEKAHREYLEKLYTTTTLVLGLLVTVGIGLIGFFQLKTKKDVRDAVDAQFRRTVEKELQQEVDEFKKQLSAALEKINHDVNQRVDGVITSTTQRFQELLFAAVPSQVEIAEAKDSEAPGDTGPPISQPSLSEEEQEILNLMDQSKYSFRSFMGIAAEAAQRNVNPDNVLNSIESLTQRGLLGRTLGKRGGERWFITEAGRKYLMS